MLLSEKGGINAGPTAIDVHVRGCDSHLAEFSPGLNEPCIEVDNCDDYRGGQGSTK